MAMNPVRRTVGANGFNPYAAGKRHYGTGRSAPNVGKTANKTGYSERDARAEARKQALIRRAGGR